MINQLKIARKIDNGSVSALLLVPSNYIKAMDKGYEFQIGFILDNKTFEKDKEK